MWIRAEARPPLLSVAIGALALAGALSAGCSVIFHVDANQCSNNGDCITRGAAFATTYNTCKSGECIYVAPPPPADAGDGGNGHQCDLNTDCKPTNPNHPEVACDVSTFTCVQLTSDQCPAVIPQGSLDSASGPPIFLGAFGVFPTMGGPLTHPTTLNYNLALSEFATGGPGIPAGPPTPARRTPVAVECDLAADVNAAMDHLINDVHVNAVVAPLDAQTLAQVFTKYDTNQNSNIFFINPLAADDALVRLQTNGLLWHMLGQPGDAAPAYVAWLSALEGYIRRTAPWNLGPSAPLKVAVIGANATATNDLANAVRPLLRWNGGLDYIANKNNGNFLEYDLSESTLNGTDLSSINVNDAATAIATFAPNLVISFASEEFAPLIQAIEIDWNPNNLPPSSAPPLPYYLLGPYNMASQGIQMDVANITYGTNENANSLRVRLSGVGVASTTDTGVLLDYETRILAANNHNQAVLGSENYYDAMYFAVYSMVAAGRGTNISGVDLGNGMKNHLVSPTGTQYTVGPSSMPNVFGALGAGGSIGLIGALGPPDFDTTTGARLGSGDIYCIGAADAGSPYEFDVLRLSSGGGADAGAFTGTFPCYPGLP